MAIICHFTLFEGILISFMDLRILSPRSTQEAHIRDSRCLGSPLSVQNHFVGSHKCLFLLYYLILIVHHLRCKSMATCTNFPPYHCCVVCLLYDRGHRYCVYITTNHFFLSPNWWFWIICDITHSVNTSISKVIYVYIS